MSSIAIIDTNVVASGLITSDPSSLQARLLDDMLAGRIRFLLSPALFAEYRDVLTRPKLRNYHRRTEEQIAAILGQIRVRADWLEPERSTIEAPDPGDQHLWDLLAAQPGATLVTGDKRLIGGGPRGSSIVLPKDFLEVE